MTFGKLDGQWGFVLGTSDNVYHTARELFFVYKSTHVSKPIVLNPPRWHLVDGGLSTALFQ